MNVLILAGAGLVAAGIPLSMMRTTVVPIVVQILGVSVIAAGAIALLVEGAVVGAAFRNAPHPAFGLDGLSAFFVIVVALSAIPALLYAVDALKATRHPRSLSALTAAFILVLFGVLCARDVSTFLVFWELMTLVPATAILVARRDRAVRRTVFIYLAITHLGGVGVWIAVLTLAHENAIGSQLVDGPRALVIIGALVGFSTKAGLMPLHSWLPRAHPVAPSHISALMSGVMLKVAIYGLIRVLFQWAAPPPLWAGLIVLGVGVLSAVGGVLYALLQRDLKRLLAFSSIENVGIVAIGLGASIILAHDGQALWSSVAFAAALLHIANHAAFKGLLFLAAGAIGDAVGALDLDRLGGLLRRMPWTGWAFLVGCLAIAGVPPLNGFASEWLTIQAALHVGFSSTAGMSVAGALAVAGLGLTSGLALFCFAKVIGLTLLGEPRTTQAAAAVERPLATRAALVGAATACVILGVVPGLLLPTLIHLAPQAAALPADTAIDLPGTGSLKAVALATALILVAALVWWLTNGGPRRAPAGPMWASGQQVGPTLQWTSAGFTKPLRLVLETVLRPRREVAILERPGTVLNLRYRLEVPNLFDRLLYAPVHRWAMRAAAVARRTQTGNFRTYVFYLLSLVLILLALVRSGLLR
ncbi:MAG: hypothetical protein ITG02_12470 [Patulibacter sp.]|nr:hypothetical protein [Patulibacter sp.]